MFKKIFSIYLFLVLCPVACLSRPITNCPDIIRAYPSGSFDWKLHQSANEKVHMAYQYEKLAFNQCLDRLLMVNLLYTDIIDRSYTKFIDLLKIINLAISAYHDATTAIQHVVFKNGGKLRSESKPDSMSRFITVTPETKPFDFAGPLRPQFNAILAKHLQTSVYDTGILTDQETQFLCDNHIYLPPTSNRVNFLLKKLYDDIQQNKTHGEPISLAGFVHSEIIRIHPFSDGNGRVARLMMNFILLQAGLKPVVFDSFEEYCAISERCATAQNSQEFIDYLKNTIESRCAHPDCSQKSAFRCSACKSKRYCSKECQAADWPKHKSSCTRV